MGVLELALDEPEQELLHQVEQWQWMVTWVMMWMAMWLCCVDMCGAHHTMETGWKSSGNLSNRLLNCE